MPHGHCYLWQPPLVWTMALADTLIGASYVIISFTLYVLVRNSKVPFQTAFIAFGLFILACGTTHFMEVYTLWYPEYWIAALVKSVTALASVATAVYMIRLFPRITELTQVAREVMAAKDQVETILQRRLTAPPEVKRILNRALYAPLGLATFVLVMAAFEAIYLVKTEKWVEHSTSVIRRAQDVRVHADQAESDYRSAWLGGLADFEAKSEEQVGEADDVLTDVLTIVSGNEVQAAMVKEIHGQIQAWKAYVAKNPIPPRDRQVGEEMRRRFLTDTSSMKANLMKSIDNFIDAERNLRFGRTKEMQMLAVVILVTVALVLILIVIFGSLARNMIREVSDSYGRALEFERSSREKAEAALAARDEFLSLASHELKTPLTSMKLQLQLLSRTENPTLKQVGDSVAVSLKQINSLGALIDDILDTTRIQSGHFTLTREKCDFSTVIEEVVERFSAPLSSVGSEVKMVLEKPIIGHWDVRRLEQVVANLLSNAIKYAPGRPIEVTVSRVEDQAVLSVKDHGLGIEKQFQEKIFGRFERGRTPKVVGGLGLGLYIVKGIVESKGGSIRVISEPGHGAEFIVELPIR